MTPVGVLAGWYARIATFHVESLFARKPVPGPPRTIFINQELPDHCFDHKHRIKREHVYSSNQVITSKYTIITFLPRNLLEQFRRIANLFFLVIAILQFFPEFTTISPGIAMLPLIAIITITALKDGYEDIKRHQSDKHVNHSEAKVLAGGDWINANAMGSKSKTFVRDLRLQRRPPALYSNRIPKRDSDSDIEYDKNGPDLSDEKYGRTSPHWKTTRCEDLRVGDVVKIMNNQSFPADLLICSTSEDEDVAFVETKNLDGETNLKSRHAVPALVHLRDARSFADKGNKFRINCDRPDTDMYSLKANVDVDGITSPVDLSMTLLRGTVLRNTDWVIGVILYTGLDTKIVLNSGSTPSKRSKIERQMNPQVIINLIILAVLALVCGTVDAILEQKYYPLGAPWLYGDNRKNDNTKINGLITFIYSLLTFQIVVPISLYISIEFVKTFQAAFIYLDSDILYEKTGQPTISKNWNLSDDLGQIQYIFSDKTGTLTQNSMIFRKCSIGGRAYSGATEPADVEDVDVMMKPVPFGNPISGVQPVEVDVWGVAQPSISGSPLQTPTIPFAKAKDPSERFRDIALLRDIEEAVSENVDPANRPHHRLLNGFFTVLALCHTVLTSVDPNTGEIEYKSQSPDEAALVQAAADVGYVFMGRDRETISVQTPSMQVEKYELLNILEFTSARKRMSVVLRKLGEGDEKLFLLTKGADNVIFQRLRQSESGLMDETERHLREFASEGFRTLTLAYKLIPEDYYQDWSARYQEATISLDDREEKLEAVSNELEQDLRLLGATAIEDRLQDGVPEAIADLKRAGIKIWVATGDKLETAIAIGRSTNLVASDSNLIVIRGGSSGRTVHQQMTDAKLKFFPENSVTASDLPRPSTSSRDGNMPLRTMFNSASMTSIVGKENGERQGGFVLVIDGAALSHAFEDETTKSQLLRLATMCEGVICCRVSPLQKALIVRLVKDGLGVMTLAIGDGANDVSMIQAADVGIGISGEEGLQAVNSSDYAIAQFRFLKKLLLVHGHWSYARNGTMILNFFYKNIVPVGVLWWFQIYSGWSGNYLFEYLYILFWNSVWTVAPVVGVGLFDRFLDAHVLMSVPELYHYGRNGTWFGLRLFFVYMLDGVVQSVVIYFLITYPYFSPTARLDGYGTSLYEYTTTMAISATMVVNIYAGLTSTAWTWWLSVFVFFGIFAIWLFTIFYSLIAPGYAVTQLYGLYYSLFTSANFWLCILLTFLLSLLPRYIFGAWKSTYAPDDLDIIRWIVKNRPDQDLTDVQQAQTFVPLRRISTSTSRRSSQSHTNRSSTTLELPREGVSRTDMATGVVSIDRGYDFMSEENGVAMRRIQSNLSERRASNLRLPEGSPSKKGKGSLRHVFSFRRGSSRKPRTPPKGPHYTTSSQRRSEHYD